MGTAASSVENIELKMKSDMYMYFNTMQIVYDADSESYVEPEELDLHLSWDYYFYNWNNNRFCHGPSRYLLFVDRLHGSVNESFDA